MRGKFPENTPKSVRRLFGEVLLAVQSIVQDNLVGVYLYGSLAMGCYNPRVSDVDIIVVAKESLSREQRRRVIECLKVVCSKGLRVELSVVCMDAVRNPRYPMMVDLHFEHWGEVFEHERDREILSNLYTVRQRGFCVWGAPVDDVFWEIPAKFHLRSVIQDLQHTRRYIHEEPERVGYDVTVYWILGSCRILAFIREGRVLSKLEGGRWGIANLPKEHHRLIRQALSRYQATEKHGCDWKRKELDTYADYMTDRILKESKLRGHHQDTLELLRPS